MSYKENLIFSEVDNRGKEMFVSPSDEITENFSIFFKEVEFKYFNSDVIFVAAKNGYHDVLGYYLDSSKSHSNQNLNISVRKIHSYDMNHFDI